ncbi:diguanylate cyclase [uncultured Agitococcus sp.]|uniref:sensor domain-containing diguanylate cyclase n=1 Tax=uncultured Agitococcus sp. TaxID=1506599 RepID=UPI0026121FFC|nr:diguanylate cyclase [uncultured Agitococcus sp.]
MEHFVELKRKLALTLSLAIAFSLLVAFVINYSVSKASVKESLIKNQLPLTASMIATDLQNERLGLIINPRPTDYQKRYLNGIDYGLNKDKIVQMLDLYKKQYGHNVYLTNAKGVIIAHNTGSNIDGQINLTDSPQLQAIFNGLDPKKDGSYEYGFNGENFLVNSSYLEDLDWFLFVDTSEYQATAKIRESFYVNIFIGLFATMAMVWLTYAAINRYQWQINQKLSDMSSSDSLTGLANRYTFDILIHHLLANAKRNQLPVSVVMIDLSSLKQLNHHIHLDSLLQKAGQFIKTSIRASDVGCRWSEDKFLVTFNNCVQDKATAIAESLRVNIEHLLHKEVGDKAHLVSVTAGLTDYYPNDTVETLLERTERALVHAQSQGSSKIMYVQPPYFTPTYMTRRLNKQLDVKAVQMQA